MNVRLLSIQWGSKPWLNEVKPPVDASDFLEVIYRASSIKIQAQIRRGEFDLFLLDVRIQREAAFI